MLHKPHKAQIDDWFETQGLRLRFLDETRGLSANPMSWHWLNHVRLGYHVKAAGFGDDQ